MTLQEISRAYYLRFNLPLQAVFLVGLWFFDINIWYTILCYILVYWLGVQAGFHKLFSHKAWEPRNKAIKYGLAVLGCFGLMGGPITWARIHRWHHAQSDTENDPHSPRKGFLNAYFMWLLKPIDAPIFSVKGHLKDSVLIGIEQRCREIVLVTLVVVFAVNPTVAMSLLLAMILTFHSEMLVNSLLHKKVNGEYSSTNNYLFMLPSGGSSLHKNHHDNAGSPTFGKQWYEIDLSYYLIVLLKK